MATRQSGVGPAGDSSRARRPPRWGLRTLGWLTLAAVSVLASNVFYAREVADFVLATLAGTLVGLVGATYCSYRGLRDWAEAGRR